MKKLLTLSLLLAGACSGMAQTTASHLLPPNTDPRIRAFYEWANEFIRTSEKGAAARTTGIRERVIAESKYIRNNGWTFEDSTRYFYTGTKGSVYNFNTLSHNFKYHIMDGLPFDFIGNAYTPEVEMDSIHHHETVGSTVPDDKVKVVYDADGDILDYKMLMYDNGTQDNGDHFINTYNAQGYLRESLLLMYNGTQWDSANRKVFTYNSQGLPVSDTTFIYDSGWRPGQRERITYNAANKVVKVETDEWSVTNAAWEDGLTCNVSYYGNGKVKDMTLGIDVGGVLISVYKDSLSYASGTDFFNFRQISMQMTGMALEPVMRYSRHLNAQSLPDTAILESNNNGSWILQEKDLLFYNTSKNPILKIVRNSGDTAIQQVHYYYEQYNDPTSATTIVHAADVLVYPNPATSELSIAWSDAEQNKSVSVVICNLAGQKVYSEQFQWKGKVQRISTTGLAPGTYLLSLTDAQGRRLHAQSILKQ